jgi:hypothetical protein
MGAQARRDEYHANIHAGSIKLLKEVLTRTHSRATRSPEARAGIDAGLAAEKAELADNEVSS